MFQTAKNKPVDTQRFRYIHGERKYPLNLSDVCNIFWIVSFGYENKQELFLLKFQNVYFHSYTFTFSGSHSFLVFLKVKEL